MSGVKGLAAMFEQRGDKPSDDRGRSPPGLVRSLGGTPTPESPRPLSKVRTSFVAIEKDGRIGLKREPSGDSVSVSSRRLSNETGATTPQPVSEKSDVFADNMAKNTIAFKSNLSPEPILPQTPTKKGSEKSIENLAPNPNPDKITDEEEPATKLKPGLPTDKAAIEGDQHISDGIGDALKFPTTTINKAKAPTPAPKSPKSPPIPAKPASLATATTKAVLKATKSPTTATPAKSHTKEPAKEPAKEPVKEPVKETTKETAKEPAKGSAKQLAKPTSSASEKKATTTAAVSKDQTAAKKTTAPKATATTSKKPAPVNLPASGTGFVKPKPKSPTRPLHLPPSLTGHTAASASKVGNGAAAAASGRQTNSRASGNAQHLNVHPASHRPSSRASASAAGTATANKGLKRHNSSHGRPRPTFGPPPKQAAKDHPVSKKESHVDEGFLARMMRPTQASQSKTADKLPVTPPRKHSTPLTTQPKRTLPARDVEGSAKKAAAKIQASGKPKAATGATKATAEQRKTAAKEISSAPLVEKTEKEVAIEPTAEAVAPVAAQTETAEAAIEAAKVSTDTAATPLVEKTEPEVVVEQLKADAVDNDKSASSASAVLVEPAEQVEDIEDLVHVSKESPIGSDDVKEEEEEDAKAAASTEDKPEGEEA